MLPQVNHLLNAHTENATRRILLRDACNSAVSQKNLESTQIQSFCSCTARQRSVVDIFYTANNAHADLFRRECCVEYSCTLGTESLFKWLPLFTIISHR